MSEQANKAVRTPTGWWPLGVLAFANLVDQFDQGVLRGVLPQLEEYWGLTDFQLGLLGFAFVFMNVLATIPAGWMADRYRRTRIMGFTLLSWSGVVALAASAVNYWNFLGVRLFTGMAHAVDDPSATSLLSDYYPARQRGRVYSVQQVTVFIGLGIGIGAGAAIGAAIGWRWAFVVVCVPASLVALLVFRLREPVRGEADDHLEPHQIEDAHQKPTFTDLRSFLGQAVRELASEMRFIFGIPTMRHILVGAGTLMFTVSAIGFWLTPYHERYSGMSAGEAGVVTAGILVFGGVIGTLGGGAVADRVYGGGPQGRITAAVWSILISFGLFLLSFNVDNVSLRVFLQFLGVVAGASASPGLRASTMDVIPARSRGMSASAFALTIAVFGTALAPPLLGIISDFTSLLAAFYIVSPPVVIGAMILLRARYTIADDIQAIITSIAARQAEGDAQPQGPADPPS
jgi:MFS family permease